MNSIDTISQSTIDYQWFAVDSVGNIGVFATGGTKLPASVAMDASSYEILAKYFLLIRGESDEGTILDRTGGTFQNWRGVSVDEKMASFGLFSYDVRDVHQFDSPRYYLVAAPAKPAALTDFPVVIREIIQRTLFDGIFSNSNPDLTLDQFT